MRALKKYFIVIVLYYFTDFSFADEVHGHDFVTHHFLAPASLNLLKYSQDALQNMSTELLLNLNEMELGEAKNFIDAAYQTALEMAKDIGNVLKEDWNFLKELKALEARTDSLSKRDVERKHWLEEHLGVTRKPDGTPKTKSDIRAFELAMKKILDRFPGHQVKGEEDTAEFKDQKIVHC